MNPIQPQLVVIARAGFFEGANQLIRMVASGLMTYGTAFALLALVLGFLFWGTGFNGKTGKSIILGSIILLVVIGAVWVAVFGGGAPDVSVIFNPGS